MFGAAKLALSTKISVLGGRDEKAATAYGTAQIFATTAKFGTGVLSINYPLADSATGYVSITPTTDFAFGTGDFTIEGWFDPLIHGGTYYLFDCRPNGTNGAYPALYLSNTRLYYYVNGVAAISSSINVIISSNGWYHIAVCRRSGVTRLYVNGLQVGSDYSDSNSYQSGSMFIGRGTDGTSNYNGYIDDFRVSNIARYITSFDKPSTGFANDNHTLALLNFEGTDGSTIISDSFLTEGHQSKSISVYGNPFIDTLFPKYGTGSLYFDGGGDFLLTPTDNDLQFTSTDSWTVEGWIFPGVVDANQRHLFGAYDINSPFTGWGLKIGDGTNNAFLNFWDGVAWRVCNTALTANTSWYHFAIVSNAGSCKMYINGVQQTTTFTATSAITNTVNNLCIGARETTGNFSYQGYLDDIRISTVARYTAAFTPPTASFVDDNSTALLIKADDGVYRNINIRDNGANPYQTDDCWVVGSSTSSTSSVAMPSNIREGDWVILFDRSSSMTTTVPAGFTTLTSGNTTTLKCIVSYKQIVNADIGTNVVGMVGSKIMIGVRCNGTPSYFNAAPGYNWATQASDTAPAGIGLTLSQTKPPMMGFALYAATSTITTRGADVAATAEYSASTAHYVKVFVYGRGTTTVPVNITMADYGSNILQCGIVRFAG